MNSELSQYPRYRMREAHTSESEQIRFTFRFCRSRCHDQSAEDEITYEGRDHVCSKNFVGINGHKDYLPHFRYGSPKSGGDEYPDGSWLWHLGWFFAHCDWDLEQGWKKRMFGRLSSICTRLQRILGADPAKGGMSGGGWYGNDTLWRTVLDINRAFLYYDRAAKKIGDVPSKQIKYIAILDGLVGGHKESPLSPTPIPCGWMLAAQNPLALDTVAAALMGLDWRKLNQIHNGYDIPDLPIANFSADQIEIHGNIGANSIDDIYSHKLYTRFDPSFGYAGHVEYNPPTDNQQKVHS